MTAIWKYEIPVTGTFSLHLPVGAKVLTVAMQKSQPVIWAEVDPAAPKESRDFVVYGTGHPMIDEPQRYIGTFQELEGRLVWHLYEAHG